MSLTTTNDTVPNTEHRHEPLYFPDGDIVFSAPRDDGSTWLFRIDRIFLARHSPVFRDMLSLPATSETNENYDGAPRVRLTDNALHVAQLLAAIYNPASIHLERPANNLPDLFGTMKLAMKYEVKTVESLIKRHVESEWLIKLVDWERRELNKVAPEHWLALSESEPEGRYLADIVPEPASAIRFALDFDCPNILPPAFLDLSLVPSNNDWESRECDPDSVFCDYGVAWSRHARWDLLGTSELLALSGGKEELQRRWNALATKLRFSFSTPIDPESPHTPCRTAFHKHMQRFLGYDMNMAHSAFEPGRLRSVLIDARYLLDKLPEWSLCGDCYEFCAETIQAWAQEVWRELPDIFDIDSLT